MQVELVEFDHLIKVKKVEEDMKLEDIINVNSKFVTHAIAEPGLRSLTVGDSLQFERRGYFRIDSIRQENSNTTYTLIFIPDGRTKGLASIATKVIFLKIFQRLIRLPYQKVNKRSRVKTSQRSKRSRRRKVSLKKEISLKKKIKRDYLKINKNNKYKHNHRRMMKIKKNDNSKLYPTNNYESYIVEN